MQTRDEGGNVSDALDRLEESDGARDGNNRVENALDTRNVEDTSDSVEAVLAGVSDKLLGAGDLGDLVLATLNGRNELGDALDVSESRDEGDRRVKALESLNEGHSVRDRHDRGEDSVNLGDLVDGLDELDVGEDRHGITLKDRVGLEVGEEGGETSRASNVLGGDQAADGVEVERLKHVTAEETDLGDSTLVAGSLLGLVSQVVKVDESVGERSLDVFEESIGLDSLLLVVLELEDAVSGLGLALEVSREGMDETSDVLHVDGVNVDVSSVSSVNVSETTTGSDLDEVLEVLEIYVAGSNLGGVEGVDTSLAILDASKVVLLRDRDSSVDHGRIGHGDGGEDQEERRRDAHRENDFVGRKWIKGKDLKIDVKVRRYPKKD